MLDENRMGLRSRCLRNAGSPFVIPIAGREASLPVETDSSRCSLPRRRFARRGGPRDRTKVDRGMGTASGHRQSAGRGRQHRRRSCRQKRAGRLHHTRGRAVDARRQRKPVRQDALRPDKGLRADHAGGSDAERAGAQCFVSGQFRAGAAHLCSRQSGQAFVWLGQQRQRGPSRR